ncbi:Hypothetical predicted protein [Pelobates cultripes]|uniref:Uncharacterized protein n=1 Tax=Pelobates cultripes TaxID=61616 RepID=A0AAD1SFZ3_PELCU|nr:Hypothetical predicted protein [Pelobates cultripes]
MRDQHQTSPNTNCTPSRPSPNTTVAPHETSLHDINSTDAYELTSETFHRPDPPVHQDTASSFPEIRQFDPGGTLKTSTWNTQVYPYP